MARIGWLTPAVLSGRKNLALAAGLVFAVVLWGGNNAGTKWIVGQWPPIWTGSTRFLAAGLLLLAGLRSTDVLGRYVVPPAAIKRALWRRGGLSLAAYIVVFNLALQLTSASHVALYLGAAPIWALLWEARTDHAARNVWRWLAALLALCGVAVLLLPALRGSRASLLGEVLGLTGSVLWTNYGRQCRRLAAKLNGAEVSAHTMWRAGMLLLPFAIVELARRPIPVTPALLGVQSYCIIAGGVAAFALWNHALRYWPASQVLLFNNLIPLSTMTWAHFCLGEPVTPTFWFAMLLIGVGVVLGQLAARRAVVVAPSEL